MGLEITGYIPDTHTAWVEWDDATKFKLNYVGTDEVETVLLEKSGKAQFKNPTGRKGKRGKKDEVQDVTVRSAMMIEYIVDGILVDWEGVSYDGSDFPYSRDNALKVLKEAKDIRDWIYTQANDISNFQEFDDLKNSESGENNV